jgi:uncharacterized protein YnzC (UPF0291/DUF896 family)
MQATLRTARVTLILITVLVVNSAAKPFTNKYNGITELVEAVLKGRMTFRQMYLEQMDSSVRSKLLGFGAVQASVQAYELDPFAVERINAVLAKPYAKTPEVMAAEQQCQYTEEQIRESLRPRRADDEERNMVVSGLSPACDTLIAYYARQMTNVPVWKMVVIVRRSAPKAQPTVLGTVGIINTPLQGILPQDVAASLAGRPHPPSVLNADELRTISPQELVDGQHVNGSMRHVSSYSTMFDYVQAMVRVLPKTLSDVVREQKSSTNTSLPKAKKTGKK